MQAINASIGFDRKMWRQDIAGSLAHAAMLAHVGIISAADEAAIRDGLGAIAARIEAGDFAWDEGLEDIHMNIEARLTQASARPASGCTPRAAATTRWRSTCASGCATRSTACPARSRT